MYIHIYTYTSSITSKTFCLDSHVKAKFILLKKKKKSGPSQPQRNHIVIKDFKGSPMEADGCGSRGRRAEKCHPHFARVAASFQRERSLYCSYSHHVKPVFRCLFFILDSINYPKPFM